MKVDILKWVSLAYKDFKLILRRVADCLSNRFCSLTPNGILLPPNSQLRYYVIWRWWWYIASFGGNNLDLMVSNWAIVFFRWSFTKLLVDQLEIKYHLISEFRCNITSILKIILPHLEVIILTLWNRSWAHDSILFNHFWIASLIQQSSI